MGQTTTPLSELERSQEHWYAVLRPHRRLGDLANWSRDSIHATRSYSRAPGPGACANLGPNDGSIKIDRPARNRRPCSTVPPVDRPRRIIAVLARMPGDCQASDRVAAGSASPGLKSPQPGPGSAWALHSPASATGAILAKARAIAAFPSRWPSGPFMI